MSFLRSTIADARPRKHSPESISRQQITPRLQTNGLNQGVSEAKEKSPDLQNPTEHKSTSLPMQENAGGDIIADVSVVREGNPIKPDVHNLQETTVTPTDIDHSPEPANTLTESLEVQYRAFDVEPAESKQINTDGSSAPDTEEQLKSTDMRETKPVKMTKYLIDNDEYTEAIVTDDQKSHDQNDTSLQTKPSYIHDHDTKSQKVDANVEGLNEPQETDKSKLVRSTNPIFVKTKNLNQTENVLKVKQQVEPESVYHEIQRSPKQTVISQKVSEQEGNSNSRSNDKKTTISSGKSKPVATKQDSSESHADNQEAFPTAKVFQSEPTSRAFEHRQSKPSYTSADKNHETPSVQIGQIDVIIEMPAKQALKPTAASLSTDLASRHYLRRL